MFCVLPPPLSGSGVLPPPFSGLGVLGGPIIPSSPSIISPVPLKGSGSGSGCQTGSCKFKLKCV